MASVHRTSERSQLTHRPAQLSWLGVGLIVALAGSCGPAREASVFGAREKAAIADTLRAMLVSTYTFDSGDIVRRFMRLYPDSGPVVSAASGSFTTDRDSLRAAIAAFWNSTGRYMQRPRWLWGPMEIEVLAPDAAVITARYTIPHWTPAGVPHVIGGAWTSVWARRGRRWLIVHEHLSDLPTNVSDSLAARMKPLDRR